MPEKKCGICVPRRESHMSLGENDYGECLRCSGHWGDMHVFRNKDGVYIGWQWNYDCGCCEPDEDERCFAFSEIPEEEALALIAQPREALASAETFEGPTPYVLQHITHNQFLWLLMRELYRLYDNGGISSRCERSLVLEAGLAVCGKEIDIPNDLPELAYEDACDEVARRTTTVRQLGLWKDLAFMTTDDFLALVAMRVQELHAQLAEPSERERAWITLLVQLTQAELCQFPAVLSEDLIREGRARSFLTAENVRGIEASSI